MWIMIVGFNNVMMFKLGGCMFYECKCVHVCLSGLTQGNCLRQLHLAWVGNCVGVEL